MSSTTFSLKKEFLKKMIQSVYNKTSIGSGEQRGSYTLENSRCGDGGDLLLENAFGSCD